MQNTSRGVTLKLSIKNFGNPVTTKQFKTIIKEEFPRFQPDIINFMTNICFPNDFLPQNACTSPIIASLCFKQVDKKLINYIEKRGGVYTRYMNELFFSFQEANVSAEKILLFIKKQLSINGYILNERQTSIMRTRQKQSVLGINIGEVFKQAKV